MADGEITIQRSLEQIQQGITDIGTASRAIDKDLRAVQAGLKFDPSNTELLAQKQELLSQKLENSTARADELRAAIAELNRIKAENGQLTDGQVKLLATYEQQLKTTSAEVTGLTGATNQQADANKNAEESTKSFSASMTEFQSNLRAVNQVMRGVDSAFKMFGGDPNSTMGQMIKQSQQAVQVMTGMASAAKLLGQSNTALGKTFGTVAIAAGAVAAAYSLGNSLINAFGEENRKTAAIVLTTTAAVGALAVAGLAAAGALSWGVAVPIIMAAVGAGAAGMTALLKKETASLEAATAATATTTSGSSITSTPTVPTYSGGGGGASNVTVQTLSEAQINSAVYSAVTRVIIEQGLNDPTIISQTSVTQRDIRRWIFSGILDPQTGTINAREVL